MMWLYLTAAITAVLGAFGWIINKDASWWLKGLMALLIVVALVAQIVIIKNEQKEKETTKYTGILEGKPVTILSGTQQVYPKLQLGNSESILVWQGPQGEPMFTIFEDNEITIWIEKDALKVSAKIRNAKGELIAELIGNEWKAAIPPKIWDRNYNNNAIEVIDETGDVVFQVVLKEDVVQFAAKMYSSTGEGFGMGSAIDPKLGPVGIFEKTKPGEAFNLKIEPMFKYPSELHMGELR